MASRMVVFHPEAIEETISAAQWYRDHNPVIAEAFLSEVDFAVKRISSNYEQYPVYVFGTRKYLFRRFPFSLVFRENSGVIEVIALIHFRRKPGYWKTRS